jgi:cis-3-alkyl-4-acyloxetan-2-one decarboxylase
LEIPDHIQVEYPFMPNWFTAGGHKLHFVDEGQGSSVVMIHGNPTWSFYYRNLIKSLKGDHRCLALDNMGCGLSDKPQTYEYTLKRHIENAVAWIEELGLETFDLVVHDWGGAIGMGIAKALSNRVQKLVILNTAAFYLNRIPKRIAVCKIPLLGDFIIRGLNGFAGPAVKMAVSKPLTKEVKEGYLFPYNNWRNRIANLRFVQDIPTKSNQETYKVLEAIESFLPELRDHSMLIGWGLRDFCFDRSFLEKWKTLFPEAEVLAYPDSGHYIIEDEKNTLIPEIRRFLSE